ncbi:MAG TPA: phosphoribosyltransferase family protein [Cytophagales bacterium]|nr:phosphoribosyltransferase family protein [Cytophagales bacterium]
MEQSLVLNRVQTMNKISRIAFEIFENNFQEDEIIIAGIYDKGFQFAELLVAELHKMCDIRVSLIKVSLDKSAPLQSQIELDCSLEFIKNKSIVLCDDVMNSGRTMAYSLKPFLNQEIKKLQTAVIVDREHKTFPISADYVGYRVSTTLKETIAVVLDNAEAVGVYMY